MLHPSLPYVVVADKAFGLVENLMCQNSGHDKGYIIYNYPLSCACRMVECTVGVYKAKWHVLLSAIQLNVENTTI